MKRKFIFSLFCLIMLGLYNTAVGQTAGVVGKVIDDLGETLPGVNVVIKGQSKGTITNIDGIYQISVDNPNDAVLVFSFVGMATKEEKVGTRRTINVSMESNSVELNEVVAVGYANMKRKDLTGSVVSVDAGELAKVPVTNVAQALAGRMSGVSVMQSEGDPNNSSLSIRVRGGISLTQDNEPLYIIDGFPTESSVFQTLSTADIESIDVLKDASSTAIYGARGANGVIVVTTKGGSEGKVNVTYDAYFTVKEISKKMELLSVAEFAKLSFERSSLSKVVPRYGEYESIDANWGNAGKGVNWQDETFRTAFAHNHRIGISGGLKDLKYNLNYTYTDDQGLMIESGLKKNQIRFKLDHRINKRATFNAAISFTDQKSYGTGTSSGNTNFSKMASVLMFLPSLGNLLSDDLLREIPNLDVYDPDLLDEEGNTLQNPAASARAEKNSKELRIYNVNAGFSYLLLKGLTFKNSTGILYRTQRNEIFNGFNSISAKRTSINGSIQNVEAGVIQTSNTLSYDMRKGGHKMSFLLGQEYITRWDRNVKTSVTNLPSDALGLNDLSLGLASPSESYYSNDDKILSFFARAYWNYREKYMLTVTARYDGSSKFSAANKWGFFPSASFAWRLSEETIIKESGVFSDLKLRVGYGSAGNNRIDPYNSLILWGSTTTPLNNGTVPGFYPKQTKNDDLRWEANQTFNVGLDMGFFNQRLVLAPEFYVNRSSDLLMRATLPYSSGLSSLIRNIGETQNIGIDFTLTTVNVKTKNFNWTTNLTVSYNKNTIMKLFDSDSFLEESGFGYGIKDYLVEVGAPIGQIYGFKTEGLYQVSDFQVDANNQFVPTLNDAGQVVSPYKLKDGVPYQAGVTPMPGNWKFANTDGNATVDANGNPLITEDDRQVIGNAQPILYGGFNNTFTYKNFDLSLFFNYSIGNDVLNATKLVASLYGWANKNTFASNDSNNRWYTLGTDGNIVTDPTLMAEMNAGKTVARWDNMQSGNKQIHSWGVEDASFLRLSNLTLGYTFDRKLINKIYLKNLRLYVSGSNLFTITKYSGYDPEVSTRNSTGLTPGVDWSAYPRSRSFTVGISVGI